MKLFILGLLMERNLHPYEIRKIIKTRNWDESFKLRDGSLYYAVDQLRESGQIMPVEVVAVPGDNRPDKVIYQITDKGKEAFHGLLNAQLKQISYPQHPLFLALPFVRFADKATTEQYIEAQLAASQQRIERLKGVLARKENYLPQGPLRMIQGFIQFCEAESAWLTVLLEDARSGTLYNGPKLSMEEIEAYLNQFPE